MSHYLSQLEGSERAQECIRNDEMMAQLHPVFVRALLPFIPPSEVELDAADLARDENKGERLAALNDQHALDMQVQCQGYIGELP